MRGGSEPCTDPVNANGVRLRAGGPHAGRVLFTATHNAYHGEYIVVYTLQRRRSALPAEQQRRERQAC